MKKPYVLAAAALATLAGTSTAFGQVVFSEDFNDGLAATRWGVVSQQEDGGTAPPDGSVDFAFDYSTLGINPNPDTAYTPGAFIQVNNTDQAGPEGESYSIFPNAFDLPAGDWVLSADLFVYNDGNSGTTEFGMIGAFLDRTDPVSPYEFGAEGGPLAWIYSGEGGAARDLARFVEGSSSSTGYNSLGDYLDIPAGTIPGFQTGTDGGSGPAGGGDPRGSWVDVQISKAGTDISWLLNGVVVDTYDNSGGFYSSGAGITFLLGAADPFNSSNLGTGTIVDNVTVSLVPEPTSLAVLGLGGLLMRRRR